MVNLLSDTFIENLGSPRQRADAYSYRAQATMQLTERRADTLTPSERTLAYQSALQDVNRAMAVRETPVDHYYRGLIFEAQEQSSAALEEYRWLAYWDAFYDYPFVDAAFEDRMSSIEGRITGSPEIQTMEPTVTGPTQTPETSLTPTPTVRVTPSPSVSLTPTQTALPPTAPPAPQLP